MHLCDRRGRDRRAERREQHVDRLAQRGGDRALGFRLRKRRHLVLQRLEVARERDADHVRPRRQELAELHVSRTKPCERGGESVGGYVRRGALDQPGDGDAEARRQRQPAGVDQRKHAFTREYVARMTEAGEVSEACNHKRQPECNATMPPAMR